MVKLAYKIQKLASAFLISLYSVKKKNGLDVMYNMLDWKCVCVSCSVVSDSATPWTVAFQAPLSMEFSRQRYWSGLPFPSPGNLPNLGIEPGSPAFQG